MIRKTYTLTLPHASFLKEGWCLIDIITEGRYWRTSRLKRAYAITCGSPLLEHEWIAEQEADEYDILAELSQIMKAADYLVTFNGTSFDLPHLRKKYEAYRAGDPISGRKTLDLVYALKPYQFLFDMKSHQLKDYESLFMSRYKIRNDAEGEILISSLLDFKHVFNDPDGLCAELEPSDRRDNVDSLVIKWKLAFLTPVDFDLTDEVFRMKVRSTDVCLKVAVTGGVLRRYYTDPTNYEYLFEEGYAAHKSLTTYVGSDRKTKAVRENCYSLVPLTSVFPDRQKRLEKYVGTVLAYLRRNIPLSD